MNQMRILNTARDCLLRFKASLYPLKSVSKDILSSAKLNSQERKTFNNLLFSWCRTKFLIQNFFEKTHPQFINFSERDKDFAILKFIAKNSFDFALSDVSDEICQSYNSWLEDIGSKKFLLSLGPFLQKELAQSFANNAEDIAESLLNRASKYLAFDKHINLDDLLANLQALALSPSRNKLYSSAIKISGTFKIEDLDPKLRPHVWFMDTGSQVIANLINAKPGDKVLDMCTGEGLKARIIAQKRPKQLLAIDINKQRILKAKKFLPAWVQVEQQDSCNLNSPKNSFDWVLIDAPCSGTGVLRRHPDLIHRQKSKDLDNYVILQQNLLREGAKILKPQGVLLYATCSLLKEENQQQIEKLLNKNKDLKAVPLSELISDDNFNFSPTELNNNMLNLLPNIHDSDGFFLAALRKT